jgi:hypothetical protein
MRSYNNFIYKLIIRYKSMRRSETKQRRKKTKQTRKYKRKMKGGEKDAEKLMELLKRRSLGDISINDDEIYNLMNRIKNDNELYDAIYKLKKHLSDEEKELVAKNAYFFQEADPSKVKRFPLCNYGQKCTRLNPVHQLSHTFSHPATLIAEAIL